MLEAGVKAPAFTLPDKDGNPISLSDFLGKKVIFYFYPKDNTPGCTRQVCAFAGSYDAFRNLDAVVIGVSKDSTASHQKFAQNMTSPSSSSPTRSWASSRPTASGRRRSSTAR